MTNKLAWLIALTLAAPAPVVAQQATGMSIDTLARTVIANNPERRYYNDQLTAAGAERAATGRLADPEVVVEFGQRRAEDPRTGVHTGDGASYSFSILQPIEFGGRIALRRAIAERQIELARIGLKQFDATLAGRARSLGYALFAADEKAGAARQVAARMRALAEVIVQRDPSGPAPALDAAILQAGAITAERQAATSDAETNSILYELNQLRGAAFGSRLRILRPDFTLPALPGTAQIAARADANNFELQSLRAQFAQQGLRVDLARKARLPILSVGPYYSHSQADNRETNYGARLSTKLPLWNSQAVGVAQEQSRQAQADATLIAAQRRISRNVFDQAAQYDAKRQALTHWQGDAPERFATAAAEADRNFRLGAIPIATYTQMQSEYLSALSAVLDTRREAFEALLQLRALNGGTLAGSAGE